MSIECNVVLYVFVSLLPSARGGSHYKVCYSLKAATFYQVTSCKQTFIYCLVDAKV